MNMKVFVCSSPDEEGKFLGIIKAFPKIWKGTILDVGCRSGKLKNVLYAHISNICYIGIDLHPPADIIANLEKGLPFSSKSFDVVVALDVLEHIDDIYKAFGELCRISNKFVVLTLPNAYELKGRIKFLLGRPLSGKYGLPSEPPQDRHRWLFSLDEARNFVHTRAQRCGFKVTAEGCLIGPRRAAAGGKFLTKLFPNLLSPWFLCLLEREEGERSK